MRQGRDVCAVFGSLILEALRFVGADLLRLELLALGARFKGFRPPFVGKEPGAYHLNAELVRTFWDHKGHADGAHNPGADGRLLADAAKSNLEITAVSGEELTKIAREVIDQPQEVLDRIKKILAQ